MRRASLRVLADVARVVRPGGWHVLDYLHAEHVRQSTGGTFVRKTITIGDLGRTFVERMRLFEPEELAARCTRAGFSVEAVFGDDDGSPLRPRSPRMILVARRQ